MVFLGTPIIFPTAASIWLNYHSELAETGNSIHNTILKSPSELTDNLRELDNIRQLANEWGLSFPVFIMLPAHSTRHLSNQVLQSSVCSENLPQQCFVELGKYHLWISSPELCFLEAARYLNFWQLLILGYDLCGQYVYDPDPRKVGNTKFSIILRSVLSGRLEMSSSSSSSSYDGVSSNDGASEG